MAMRLLKRLDGDATIIGLSAHARAQPSAQKGFSVFSCRAMAVKDGLDVQLLVLDTYSKSDG